MVVVVVVKYPVKAATKCPRQCQCRFPDSSARQCRNKFPSKTASKPQDKAASKFLNKTAKVSPCRFPSSKGERSKEECVRWPTPVIVEVAVIMEEGVSLVLGCLIMEIVEAAATVEGLIVEGEVAQNLLMQLQHPVEEAVQDLHTQENRTSTHLIDLLISLNLGRHVKRCLESFRKKD